MQIAEPEYREIVVEALSLMGKLDIVLRTDRPNFPKERPLEIDAIVHKANELFVKHNVIK